MAGESAEQLARRQRERAERLMRSAERYERGAVGERATGTILDGLRSDGWVVFHDVRWPGRVRANLDHVVVGPPGVFVIDSKNWSGRIEVRENTFWCHGRRQDRTIAAAGDAALAVAGLVSAPATGSVRSALCFVRDEAVAGWCYDVMVCSTSNLREMLLTRPPVLLPDQVKLAALELEIGFRAASNARVVHSPVSRAPRPQRVERRTPVTRPRRSPGRALLGLGSLVLMIVVVLGLVALLPRIADLTGRELADRIAPAAAYEDCAALRRDHPHGVGSEDGVSDLKRQRRLPTIDPRIYEANVGLDRDEDGIACERTR